MWNGSAIAFLARTLVVVALTKPLFGSFQETGTLGTAPDGRLCMVYHQKDGKEYGWKWFLAIDPLWFDDNGVIHVKTTRRTQEPAPAVKPGRG